MSEVVCLLYFPSVKVGDEWVTGEAAVQAFRGICLQKRWLFVSVPNEMDFGKDGYVDATDDGLLTGDAFAVQIKGGKSYRAKDGYRIPVGGHRSYWRDSNIPIVGVVQDPDDERLRWVNLTEALRRDKDAPTIFVPGDAYLDDPAQQAALVESIRTTLGEHEPQLPLGLGSLATRDQIDAVWGCFALAARDPAALIAIRRMFLALDRSASIASIAALSFCTPHPDVIWTNDNQLPTSSSDTIRASMRWTVPEVAQLLAFVGEEGFARGSLGQAIFMLLIEDPDLLGTLHRVVAWAENLETAAWAGALATHLSTHQLETWHSLLDARPSLADTFVGDYVTYALAQFGSVSVFD